MECLLQTQGSFGGFFCLKFYILRCFLDKYDFQSSFLWFLGDKIRNSNVFLRMCFRERVSNLLLVQYCYQRNIIPFQAITKTEIEYLTEHFHTEVGYSSLNTAS